MNTNISYNENIIRLIGSESDPWFRANDICCIIGYKGSSTRSAIARHVDENDRKYGIDIASMYNIHLTDPIGKKSTFLNESGLMDLVCSCRLKSAKDFKRYIINEIRDLALDEYKKSLLPSEESIEESIEDMIEETLTEETIEDPTYTTDKNVNEPYESMMLILECENEMLKSKLETCKDIIKSKNEMIKLLEERIV